MGITSHQDIFIFQLILLRNFLIVEQSLSTKVEELSLRQQNQKRQSCIEWYIYIFHYGGA